MVIDPNSIVGSSSGTANKAKAAAPVKNDSPAAPATKASNQAADSVSLSTRAQDITKLEANLAAASDVDTSRVDAVRRALESGQYEISPESIADKIIAEESVS